MPESFFNKVEFCEIFKNTFLTEHLLVPASAVWGSFRFFSINNIWQMVGLIYTKCPISWIFSKMSTILLLTFPHLKKSKIWKISLKEFPNYNGRYCLNPQGNNTNTQRVFTKTESLHLERWCTSLQVKSFFVRVLFNFWSDWVGCLFKELVYSRWCLKDAFSKGDLIRFLCSTWLSFMIAFKTEGQQRF